MITNYELRQRMRKVIRPNLQVLLVIALIASLPGLLTSVVSTLTGWDLATWLYNHGVDTSATAERLLEEIQAFALAQGWKSAILNLAQALVSPVLLLGLINGMLTLLRGGTVVVGTAFSRLNAFLRSVGVTLLVAVKVFLWTLPALALMMAATWLLFLTESVVVYSILLLASSILMTVLMVMATYRYAMASFFLADEPEMGVLACVRQSKAVMKKRKLQLLSLELPYVLGGSIASTLIASLLGGVIGSTISMMVQLIFIVFIYGARSTFYEAYARPAGGRAHAFQSDPYHDEMKE